MKLKIIINFNLALQSCILTCWRKIRNEMVQSAHTNFTINKTGCCKARKWIENFFLFSLLAISLLAIFVHSDCRKKNESAVVWISS